MCIKGYSSISIVLICSVFKTGGRIENICSRSDGSDGPYSGRLAAINNDGMEAEEFPVYHVMQNAQQFP